MGARRELLLSITLVIVWIHTNIKIKMEVESSTFSFGLKKDGDLIYCLSLKSQLYETSACVHCYRKFPICFILTILFPNKCVPVSKVPMGKKKQLYDLKYMYLSNQLTHCNRFWTLPIFRNTPLLSTEVQNIKINKA